MKIDASELKYDPAVVGLGADTGVSLIDQAQLYIRREILSGNLKPGQKLKIVKLSEKLEIGPTPVREALSRLVSQGMVATESHRGFFVPRLSFDELEDILDQRILVEGEALKDSIINGDDDWEAGVQEAYKRLEKLERSPDTPLRHWGDWEEQHQYFHRMLVAGARSTWSQKLNHILLENMGRYRHVLTLETYQLENFNNDHCDLYLSAINRRPEEAVEILSAHIRNNLDLCYCKGMA
ncbi:GntR family transcriptional regulator [Rhodobacteraceae bacterium RKSG542]|uniref:GntR family transcriptional regulator n=1 Tax=Pseudovibrio flavus TaxID=2529854 RepID=UPI0012BC9FB2|nr:GntR family transcriptional regulator [Pseudovibrio flavus]MTI15749.1 GntR family transcriptional regulator [Pseudovibrio flavus]